MHLCQLEPNLQFKEARSRKCQTDTVPVWPWLRVFPGEWVARVQNWRRRLLSGSAPESVYLLKICTVCDLPRWRRVTSGGEGVVTLQPWSSFPRKVSVKFKKALAQSPANARSALGLASLNFVSMALHSPQSSCGSAPRLTSTPTT